MRRSTGGRPIALAAVIVVVAASCSSGGDSASSIEASTTVGARTDNDSADEPSVTTAEDESIPTTATSAPVASTIPAATTIPELTPFCAELDRIGADAHQTGEAITSESDPFLGLVLSIAALGDLQIYLDRLSDVAPGDVAADLTAIAEAQDLEMGGALSNPVVAIANAVIRGLSVGNAFARVDAYATAECGKPVFGDAVFFATAGQDPLPRHEDGLRFFRVSSFYGEKLCDSRDHSAVDGDIWVIGCGNRAYGINVDQLAMVWSTELPDLAVIDAEANGGTAAFTMEQLHLPEGLNPSRYEVRLIVLDSQTGNLISDVALNDGTVQTGISEDAEDHGSASLVHVADDGSTIYIQAYPRPGDIDEVVGEGALVAIGSDGSLRYQVGDAIDSTIVEPLGVIVSYVSDLEGGLKVLDRSTGEKITGLDSYRLDPDRCSTGLTLSRSGDPEIWDPATNSTYVLPGLGGNNTDAHPTEAGVLLMQSDRVALVNLSGDQQWLLDDNVVAGVWWVDGHLVVRNKAGDYLQVNITTGTEAGPWPSGEEPPFADHVTDGWEHWVSSRGDTIFREWMPGPCGQYE